jgi:uncharacterized membrane protein YkvA (DUF1232 family)
LAEELRPVSKLRADVASHLQYLEHLAAEAEFLDLALARRVAGQCDALLSAIEERGSEEIRGLVQAAVLYFVEKDDVEADVISPIGFDDDAEVVALVARAIGREDLLSIDAMEEP